MEAVYAGKPTLSIVPQSEQCKWCPSVNHKYTPCVYTRESIRSSLKYYNKQNKFTPKKFIAMDFRESAKL